MRVNGHGHQPTKGSQMIPKHNHIRSKAIRDAARGEDCTICGIQDGTVVFAHLDESWAGKGMRIKADDIAGMFLCVNCHSEYGHARSTIDQWQITRAMYRTWRRLWDRGIIGELKKK